MTAPLDEARLRELAEARLRMLINGREDQQLLDPSSAACHDATVGDLRTVLDALSAERERADRAVAVARYYGEDHAAPSDGPWGAFSTDFGDKARAFLATQKAEEGNG